MTEPPTEPPSWPTSDPATWVPIPPNTVMAAAAALQAVADRYEVNGWPGDAGACHELSARLTAHLLRWAEQRRTVQNPERPTI